LPFYSTITQNIFTYYNHIGQECNSFHRAEGKLTGREWFLSGIRIEKFIVSQEEGCYNRDRIIRKFWRKLV